MQQETQARPEVPTLTVLIRALGERTNVVAEAVTRLRAQGHAYSPSTIYTTIRKNGSNNATIMAALLDVIEQEQASRQKIANRLQALAE